MKEITIHTDDGDFVARVFVDGDDVKGIVKDGFKINVDGEDLKKQ